MTLASFYRRKRILILGGMGYMGLNLARALVDLESIVIIGDLRVPDGGISMLTMTGLSECGCRHIDICDYPDLLANVVNHDIIFNLAGRSGVEDSFQYPGDNLNINCRGHLNLLQACRDRNPDAIVVFPSSCLVYGHPHSIFVSEDAPLHPNNPYAIHRVTCEMYNRLYREVYGIHTVTLRISNPVGPYQFRVDGQYGVYNYFIYLAVNDRDIPVYGDGTHIRDIIPVADVVQAFLHCAMTAEGIAGPVNVGRGAGIALCDYVRMVMEIVGSGRVIHVDWPKRSGWRPVDFVADTMRIQTLTDWHPTANLPGAIITTAEFYRQVDTDLLET